MIVDSLVNLKRYGVPKTEAICKFIAGHDCAKLADGDMEIEGRGLFVKISSYTPKPAAENKFEAHRLYADLQYMASGTEVIQTARIKELTSLTEYDARGDYEFFKACEDIHSFVVKTGEFAVFYPNEAHRPSCLHESHNSQVKKLVFKIRI
jgi:YhcH/YjgK/YiaL family protein